MGRGGVFIKDVVHRRKVPRSGWFETTYRWSSWAYNSSRADKHVARAWISFRYLSSYNSCPHWSVRTCIKIFFSYSVHCWKHKFLKVFGYSNISMCFCIPLARTRSICLTELCRCTVFLGISSEHIRVLRVRYLNFITDGPPYPRFTAAWKKMWKIKEINGSQDSKRAQYVTHLPLSPLPTLPRKLATFLLLAFSLFELVAALSQCLWSESNKKTGEVSEYPQ